jgi:hypothetical protein
MKHLPIEGHDITEAKPVGGVFLVAGFIRSPHDRVCIRWEVDGSSGTTYCEAWQGQWELDCMTRAGYQVKSIARA